MQWFCFVESLLIVATGVFCVWSMFCYNVQSVLSSFALISLMK